MRALRFVRLAIFAGAASVLCTWAYFTAVSDGAVAPSGRLGGDFPAFYSAGELVRVGRGGEIYEPASLREVQAPLLPESNSYLKFAYPPFVAALYAPLSALPYRVAYALHTLLMVLLLVACAWVAEGKRDGLLVASTLLLFYPLADAIRGGQNTALTLALVVGSILCTAKQKSLLAGGLVGVLLFKPQFFLPFWLALLFLNRSRTFLAGGALSACGLYALGAWVLGWDWPRTWSASALQFRNDDFVQGDQLISLPQQLHVLGIAEPPLTVVFGLYVVGVALALWVRARTGQWLGFVCTVLLFVPHCVYYDAGLLALGWPGLFAADVAGDEWRPAWCAALIVGGALILWSGSFATLICLAGVLWSFRAGRSYK